MSEQPITKVEPIPAKVAPSAPQNVPASSPTPAQPAQPKFGDKTGERVDEAPKIPSTEAKPIAAPNLTPDAPISAR
jgi:hypothetical protein